MPLGDVLQHIVTSLKGLPPVFISFDADVEKPRSIKMRRSTRFASSSSLILVPSKQDEDPMDAVFSQEALQQSKQTELDGTYRNTPGSQESLDSLLSQFLSN